MNLSELKNELDRMAKVYAVFERAKEVADTLVNAAQVRDEVSREVEAKRKELADVNAAADAAKAKLAKDAEAADARLFELGAAHATRVAELSAAFDGQVQKLNEALEAKNSKLAEINLGIAAQSALLADKEKELDTLQGKIDSLKKKLSSFIE